MNLRRSFSSEAKASLFIDKDGALYGWGGFTHCITPTLINLPKINDETPKIISLASGMYHAIALTDTQRFIGWGSNGSGELGTDSTDGENDSHNNAKILEISIPEHVTQVFASASASGAITKEGSVYLWGDTIGNIPKKMEIPEPVIEAAGGLNFQIWLTKSGKVYGLGDNDYHQISPVSTKALHEPTLVPHLPTTALTQIYAGCRHCYALTKDGGLLAWGCNAYGNLGVGDGETRKNPEYILRSGVVDMASGWGHALALMDDGSLRVWGCDFEGQLADLGTTYSPQKWSFPEIQEKSVAMIGCGFSHTFLMTKDGKVYLWGAGYDGQLGFQDKMQRRVPSEIPGLVFRVPTNIEDEFRCVFSWLYLGRSNETSSFFVFPVEVVFHFVTILVRSYQ
jgi:alpha-tubulin suppressor-like RCC1 family protein